MLVPINDIHDDRLSDYVRLTDVALRKKLETENGLYMAESSKVIQRAIAAGHRPRSVLADERWLADLAPSLTKAGGDGEGGDIPVYVCDEEKLQEIAGFHLHRGAIAAMNRPALADPRAMLADRRTRKPGRSHQRGSDLPLGCSAWRRCSVRHIRLCRPPLQAVGSGFDGNRLPGSLDQNRRLASKREDAF